MAIHFKPYRQWGLHVAAGLILAAAPIAAQRGAGPRGGAPAANANNANNAGRGGANNPAAQARQQIQSDLKAALDSANAMFRLAMASAKQDAQSDDATARSHARLEEQQAQLNRKNAIDQARAKANAALAALKK